MIEYILLIIIVISIVIYALKHNAKRRERYYLSKEELDVCSKAFEEENKNRSHYEELINNIEYKHSHDAERYLSWLKYYNHDIDSTFDCVIITIGMVIVYYLHWLLFSYKPDNNGELVFVGVVMCGLSAFGGGLFGDLFALFANKLYKTRERNMKYYLVCIGCSLLASIIIFIIAPL